MWMTDIFVGRRVGERIGRVHAREGGSVWGVSICVYERDGKRKQGK